MGSLLEINKKISSIKSTKKVMESLKAVSIVKQQKYAQWMKDVECYLSGISQLFFDVFTSPDHIIKESNKMLFGDRNSQKKLIVIIGSDLGMCGNFNSLISTFVTKALDDDQQDLIVFGKKIYAFLTNNYPDAIDRIKFMSSSENKKLSEIKLIAQKLFNFFLHSDYSGLSIAYLNENDSQGIVMSNVIPLTQDYFVNLRNIKTTMYSSKIPYPNIIADLFPLYFESLIIGGFLSSKKLEHILRRDLMLSATENAKDLLEEYELSYNKLRQSKITQQIVETTTSSRFNK